MNERSRAAFPTITPDVCRRYIATGRKQQNTVAALIRARLCVKNLPAKTETPRPLSRGVPQ